MRPVLLALAASLLFATPALAAGLACSGGPSYSLQANKDEMNRAAHVTKPDYELKAVAADHFTQVVGGPAGLVDDVLIYVVRGGNHPNQNAVIGFFSHGCLVHVGALDVRTLNQLLQAVGIKPHKIDFRI